MIINTELKVLAIGRVFQVVIALAIIKVATQLLDAAEMGNFYLITSVTGFFGLFLVNPIGQYINRKTHRWFDESKLLNVLFLYNIYLLFISFFSVLVVWLLFYLGVGRGFDLFHMSICVAVFVYFNSCNQTLIPMLNMLGKRLPFVLFTLISQLLYLIIAYALVIVFEAKAVYWFLGQGIAFGISAIGSYVYFVKKVQYNFSFANAVKMINLSSFSYIYKFSFPLSIGVLFFWLQTQSYGILVEKYLGSEFLGFLGVGLVVAMAVSSSFESLTMQYLYPKIYKSMDNDLEFSVMISKVINLIVPIYFFLAIFLSFQALFLVAILVDEKYVGSYVYTIFGAWIAFFTMSSNILANIAHAKLKTKELIYSHVTGGITAVVFLIISVDSGNYELYVPSSLLFASALAFIVMLFRMNKIVKVCIKISSFFYAIVFSMPFSLSLALYDFSGDVFYLMSVLFVFGLYFLLMLYVWIKRNG
ncbi:hypothetical protein [Amphritea sp.]|uniref:hypothetical protein n=1 Tax=Amphritea sp. TaxID=1872502 RepID=UPI0025C3D445|nr:hypothetical protein [Amphritea sp.]